MNIVGSEASFHGCFTLMLLKMQHLNVVSGHEELGCKLWLQALLSAPSCSQGELENGLNLFFSRFKFLPVWI